MPHISNSVLAQQLSGKKNIIAVLSYSVVNGM